MRKGARRSRAGPGGVPGEPEPGGGFPKRAPAPRSLRRLGLPLGLAVAASCLLGLCLLWSRPPGSPGRPEEEVEAPRRGSQLDHKPRNLQSSRLKHLSSQVDVQRLWDHYLKPMLVERYSGSPGNIKVRQFILEKLRSLEASWQLELDAFEDRTPHGTVSFANVVATLDPTASWRLVFACHYDSKYFPQDERGRAFLGATDSAVPCSILLELVTVLDKLLLKAKEQGSKMTLQLLFFDGEEAFQEWSETDSLYGARHLAEHMERTPHRQGTTQLHAITLFVLLDLLGAPQPTFQNHFRSTAGWFERLVGIEKRLHQHGLLQSHPQEQLYFQKGSAFGFIEDDHAPFLRKGQPTGSLIGFLFRRGLPNQPAFTHTATLQVWGKLINHRWPRIRETVAEPLGRSLSIPAGGCWERLKTHL